MTLYKHKRTGVLYQELFSSFDVATQEHHTVYVSLENGQIFNRNQVKFAQNFEIVELNSQAKIVPKEPHE